MKNSYKHSKIDSRSKLAKIRKYIKRKGLGSEKVLSEYNPDIGLMVRVFAKWPRRPGFNPRLNHTKDLKNGI